MANISYWSTSVCWIVKIIFCERFIKFESTASMATGLNGYTLNDRLFISMDGFNGSLNAQALRDMIEKLILPKVMV